MDYRALQNKTSCTLSTISPTTTNRCPPPGTQAPDFPSAPRTKPFSGSESGLGWGGSESQRKPSPVPTDSNLRAQKLLPCAYPRSRQVGSLLCSRDRSIESLEYKDQREASVEYKAAGAGLALQLEKAPGRKPGESERAARGWGRLESSPWPRSLHREEISSQPTKAEGFLAKTVFPPAGGKVICT